MSLWLGNTHHRQRSAWDIEPFTGFGFEVLGDFEREFRRMNRELNRLERDFTRTGAGSNQPALLADRNMSILPNIVVDTNGQRQAQFQFDTRGFQPEDITIKTENGNKLIVSGKHEEKGEDHHHFREFRRIVSIPEGTNPEQMQSRLSPQGILTVQAPYNPPAIQNGQDKDKVLPIQHERSDQKALDQKGQK